MTSAQSIAKVAAYYESKTDAVLRRYGPGPRVHYHTGLFNHDEPLSSSVPLLRKQLVAAQERTLVYMVDAWRMRSVAPAELLDVGCGLGGSAIFCAQEFASNVTAVTIAPSHVKIVEDFAAQAGVSSKIRPMLCDALEVPGVNRFDVVLAIESSCHLPREAWFCHVAGLLRKGGHLFVADYMLEQSRYQEPISRHWCARVGSVKEYLDAARSAGLAEVSIEDVSSRTLRFWDATQVLIKTESLAAGSGAARAKFEESLAAHALMRQGFAGGGLRYMLMSFWKPTQSASGARPA